MTTPLKTIRLRQFIHTLAEVVDQQQDEQIILEQGAAALRKLIQHDDWLPDDYAQPDPARYQQYLLHADAQSRFSVVSFVWGAGQKTPIHDHRVWGLVGVLRGAEISQQFRRQPEGLSALHQPSVLKTGEVEAFSPRIGDIHQVSNAFNDRTSISIHVYGGNIGAIQRATYQPDGLEKPFISGYSNLHLPNIWDLSREH